MNAHLHRGIAENKGFAAGFDRFRRSGWLSVDSPQLSRREKKFLAVGLSFGAIVVMAMTVGVVVNTDWKELRASKPTENELVVTLNLNENVHEAFGTVSEVRREWGPLLPGSRGREYSGSERLEVLGSSRNGTIQVDWTRHGRGKLELTKVVELRRFEPEIVLWEEAE